MTPKEQHAVRDSISLHERKRRSTPSEFAQFLRSNGKVFFWPAGNFWVVTDYEVAKTALRDPSLSCDRSSFFISRMPNLDLQLVPDFFGVVKRMMVMGDGADHLAKRGVAAKSFSDEIVKHYREVTDETVKKLIGAVNGKQTFDFAWEVAKLLPSMILADLFGIIEEERGNFFKWSLNMTQFFGGASQYRNEDGIEVNTSAKSITDYLKNLIEERRKKPGNDFLSLMIEQNEIFKLSGEDLVAQAAMMVVAGQVTTTDQICNNFFTLLSQPKLYEELVKNPSILPTAIEELNRWDPAVTFLFRVASADTQMNGISIAKGDVVFISTHAVNRDPVYFADPERLHLHRSPNLHFAYGNGSHYCLGASLARIEMLSLFSEVLKKYPTLRVSAEHEPVRDHYSLAFSGFKQMMVTTGDLQ